jgi:hypothetical protein
MGKCELAKTHGIQVLPIALQETRATAQYSIFVAWDAVKSADQL